jgi:hypothetical protein
MMLHCAQMTFQNAEKVAVRVSAPSDADFEEYVAKLHSDKILSTSQ